MPLELDFADQVLMTVHPLTAARVHELCLDCLMSDWYDRSDFYTDQIAQARNPRLSHLWALICLALASPGVAEQDQAAADYMRTFTDEEIATWNARMFWHCDYGITSGELLQVIALDPESRTEAPHDRR